MNKNHRITGADSSAPLPSDTSEVNSAVLSAEQSTQSCAPTGATSEAQFEVCTASAEPSSVLNAAIEPVNSAEALTVTTTTHNKTMNSNSYTNNGSATAAEVSLNMNTNTRDFVPADLVEVLEAGVPLPSPEDLGDKCAAYCVFDGVLKPIASDPTPMALRYLGTWAEGAAGLRAENLDLNDTDTADRYELYVRVEQAGTQYFAVEADDSARLVIPGLGVDITKPVSSLNIARCEGVVAQAGFYRISQLSYSNIQYGSANAVALKVSHDTQPIPDGDYSGFNTFSRSFSSAPNIKLYVLLRGTVPQKVATPASPCGCGSEGQGKAELGCARWSMAFGQFPMMAGMPSAQIGLYSASLAAADLTPAVLRVDHPMMRTLSVAGDTATVQPPFGEPVQYSIESGKPLDV
ncbi:MAG: hypothetical protein MR894_08650, partial [Akkermansia muciniphila]|nr:hypothetical protein [Akkermansia muciniphila]